MDEPVINLEQLKEQAMGYGAEIIATAKDISTFLKKTTKLFGSRAEYFAKPEPGLKIVILYENQLKNMLKKVILHRNILEALVKAEEQKKG